jgi:ATP-binding protein involved in chromosome partitioning
MQPIEANVRDVLSRFPDPETGRSIVQLEQARDVTFADGRLELTLALTTWAAPLWEDTRNELAGLLRSQFPEVEVTVKLAEHRRPAEPSGQLGLAVKSVLAVGSGKGGVGKSSVAAFLAHGLARAGARVGLLDADLYGPSIPHLFGLSQAPGYADERIQPVEISGMKLLSMGLLVPPGEAVVWRGPMLHRALSQLLGETAWGELDYLVIDMPPGTGDVSISLAQLLPSAGAVVVCTPQEVALLDAVKAIKMFRTVNMEVLGMVENMSFFLCSSCGTRHDIFGTGGARRLAAEAGVPFLGEIPLETRVRALADEGRIIEAFDHAAVRSYLESICHALVRSMADARRRKPRMPSLNVLG